jgi:hypothetical protein
MYDLMELQPQAGRWVRRSAVPAALAAVMLLSACDEGSSYTPPAAAKPVAATGQPVVPRSPENRSPVTRTPVTRPTARTPATRLPSALVGSWSGDDQAGVGSWTIVFTSDGRYRMSNARRNARIDGRVTAGTTRLVMTPAGGQPVTATWSVSGGRLSLNGEVYLRTGGGTGTTALAGRWMSLKNTYSTVTFTTDGRYAIDDPVNGGESGTYRVSGGSLTVTARGGVPITYGWSVQNGFLRLRRSDGRIAEYTRAG